MTTFENQLWKGIEEFTFDDPGTQLTFAARLACENGWNANYTQRVIAEYKRFIYLCCISPTGVTPSDPVDQAWHLHLTYTKSYWNNLCRGTMGQEIHHNPTKGGSEERQKFSTYYKGLHELYLENFGTPPPPDIWHDSITRFSDIDFQRVNLQRYWLIKKPSAKIRSVAFELIMIAVAMLCIQSSGKDFIIVFIVMMIASALSKFNDKGNGNKRGGGTNGSEGMSSCTSGCSDSGCSSHGDSGCSSSGCSSGCSGCGGGCGGGD
ncbi:glycine-rich domain-containing protein [Flavobacterium zepuense]|uniref:glycine-rich domain-containing protein n=1 Tax=Flavobacterium zepuense TaxID=2593302 RepID=UPI00163DE624|nr:hypothetical protein [Flavobacterium zepuense]